MASMLFKWLKNIFSTNHNDSNGLRSLYTAIRQNDLHVVKCLVAANPDNVNIILTEKGLRPLHLNALYGSEEICQFLLQNGGNVNACDGYGFTPLFFVHNKKKY